MFTKKELNAMIDRHDDDFEARLEGRMETMTPQKRKEAEKFIRDRRANRQRRREADAAWEAYTDCLRWRFLKRRKLERAAVLLSARFFAGAGDYAAAASMTERLK